MRTTPQLLLPLTSKPFELNLTYLAQRIYRSGQIDWVTFSRPWPKVTAVTSISKNLLVCAIKWETLIGSLQNMHVYCPSHAYYLIKFWRSYVGKCYFIKFSLKISDVFFQGQTLFWPYLRNGWSYWCETKRKCIGWILDICDLDLWPHSWPWPWCFKVKFRNSCISGIVGLINVKWKGSELIWYWADYMTLPFDHTHDLDLGVSGSESEIALSQEWVADRQGTKMMWVIH